MFSVAMGINSQKGPLNLEANTFFKSINTSYMIFIMVIYAILPHLLQ